MNQTMTGAALELAAAGWPVFPVTDTTKRPKTAHGHLDATTNATHIANWRREFDSNGAIATPTGNGLLVIDVDPRNGGSVPAWCPETLSVHTQSGGIHLYYKVDEDIKSRAGLFGPGVDSKSSGGYVLMPPSPGYHWADAGAARAFLRAADLRAHFHEDYTAGGSALRLPPEQWQRGIIHDQVVAWAAYFAGHFEEEDATAAVWALVDQARAAGVRIDNDRDHIGSALRWVLRREAHAHTTPSLD